VYYNLPTQVQFFHKPSIETDDALAEATVDGCP